MGDEENKTQQIEENPWLTTQDLDMMQDSAEVETNIPAWVTTRTKTQTLIWADEGSSLEMESCKKTLGKTA